MHTTNNLSVYHTKYYEYYELVNNITEYIIFYINTSSY